MSPSTTAPSRSQRLRQRILLVHPRLEAVASRFWTHPELPRLYPEFLFLVHSMIRASVPLLEAAARRSRDLGDEVGDALAAYFEHHAGEEAGHDDWLLDDLEVLGVPRQQVLERMPSLRVAALIGAHYYWIEHVHPVALMGYLAVLEGNPPRLEELVEIRRRTSLPEEAFRTMIKHAHLDPHHRDDLNDEIDRLPLSPRQSTLLTQSAFHTVDQVSDALEELLEAAG